MTKRVELWSCGGGRQSAGIAALIVMGRLPKPDHIVMAALEWELRSTWDYVCGVIRPAMKKLGIPFTLVPRKKYATVDFWSGQDGQSTVLPVYSDKSGKPSKLSEYCSGEWKREVVLRWASEQDDWKKRGVNNWVGISYEEKRRRRAAKRQWMQPTYPLLDVVMMSVAGCLQAVDDLGWPEPPRSRCAHCPNQSDGEWLQLTPHEFDRACVLEDNIRKIDPHAWFHKSMIPLRQVKFEPAKDTPGLFGGCSSGMCF